MYSVWTPWNKAKNQQQEKPQKNSSLNSSGRVIENIHYLRRNFFLILKSNENGNTTFQNLWDTNENNPKGEGNGFKRLH